jgi:catechol 2,3-dioxygenase-like lactoylglutathione lyase family enzyme
MHRFRTPRIASLASARARASIRAALLAAAAAAAAPASFAQLPEPNAAGVTTGHIHLTVPDVAKHSEIWAELGGKREPGRLNSLSFPGMYVLLTEGEPAAPSIETSVNHIGFAIQDYAAYKRTLESIGATIFYDNEQDGQILADLPDGVRVEFLTVDGLAEPVAFHHIHLVGGGDLEALRDWYTSAFGAEAGERRGLPSAIVPGGRVDIMGARGDAPRGSRGAAIDHIGFDVADMDRFAAHLGEVGIAFDSPPRRVESIGLTIAFVTDPVGSYIEITEGLAGRE